MKYLYNLLPLSATSVIYHYVDTIAALMNVFYHEIHFAHLFRAQNCPMCLNILLSIELY
jgi:hypothetical protein